MGYMGSCYNVPEAIFYLLNGGYIRVRLDNGFETFGQSLFPGIPSMKAAGAKVCETLRSSLQGCLLAFYRALGSQFYLPSPSQVDRLWGSYYNVPKAIFYLLKGDCR